MNWSLIFTVYFYVVFVWIIVILVFFLFNLIDKHHPLPWYFHLDRLFRKIGKTVVKDRISFGQIPGYSTERAFREFLQKKQEIPQKSTEELESVVKHPSFLDKKEDRGKSMEMVSRVEEKDNRKNILLDNFASRYKKATSLKRMMEELFPAERKIRIETVLKEVLDDLSRIYQEEPQMTLEMLRNHHGLIKMPADYSDGIKNAIQVSSQRDNTEVSGEIEKNEIFISKLTIEMSKILDLYRKDKGEFRKTIRVLPMVDDNFEDLFCKIGDFRDYNPIFAQETLDISKVVEKTFKPKIQEEEKEDKEDKWRIKEKQKTPIMKKSGSPLCLKSSIYKYDFLEDVTEEDVKKLIECLPRLRSEKWLKESENLLRDLEPFHEEIINLEEVERILQECREKAKTDGRVKK